MSEKLLNIYAKKMKANREEYLEFVSKLFGIELKEFKFLGFKFDGKKDGYPVIVFDHHKFKDSLVDENYLREFNKEVGKSLGGKIYIVAPINSIDFLDDIVEIGKTKYCLLKITYKKLKKDLEDELKELEV